MTAAPRRGAAVVCPNCDTRMDREALEGRYHPRVEVDLCFSCNLLWLDEGESIQLSPQGTIDLFKILHARGGDARQALRSRLECPRCRGRLVLTHDIGKSGRFAYYRCSAKHGRLTPFSEFLKEKQFVRELSAVEKRRVQAELKQVRCSSCGAPVDLGRGFQCEHCGAPLTVLDADAVEKTIRELEAKEAERSDPVDAEAKVRMLAAMETLRAGPEGAWQRHATGIRRYGPAEAVDLLTSSIGFIFGG